MSEWITDRLPTEEDADINYCVYDELGVYTHWQHIVKGRAWMPIIPPLPYVRLKTWRLDYSHAVQCWCIWNKAGQVVNFNYLHENDQYREAAERIAAIYEEVLP